MDELFGPYYIRFTVLDEPGVLSTISGILGNHDISIESVVQKGRKKNSAVPLVMLTHTAKESSVSAALEEINRLDAVVAPPVKIRLLEDEDQ